MSNGHVDLGAVESYLLDPAPLSQIMSFDEFRKLFPSSLRSSPHLIALYRAAQDQRDKDIAHVANNIAMEQTRRNELLATTSSQSQPGIANADPHTQREMALDQLLATGEVDGVSSAKPRTLKTVLLALEESCKTLEAEIQALDIHQEELMERLRTTVGDLSDLRYGKLPEDPGSGSLADSATENLEALRHTIEQKSSSNQ